MSLSHLFWAKLGTETWPTRYHPALCHLIDVAAVTQKLWENVFRPQFRHWLSRKLGLEEDHCARWLAFWSGAHDIGKVAPCFQDRNDQRTDGLKKSLQDAGFVFYSWDKPHGTISSAILAELLVEPKGWPPLERRVASQVAVAVGGHHGLFPNDWSDVADLLRASPRPCAWDGARREIILILARLIGIGSRAPQITDTNDQSVFMALAGLTSVADWIGSNQTFFEPVGCPAFVQTGCNTDDYFQHALNQAHKALEVLGWLGQRPISPTCTFKELFADSLPGEPRPLQYGMEEIAQRMVSPSLVIAEAPMGEGKTEAAWYFADIWERSGGQGNYVALPTMATSNQMFERVGRFLEADHGGNLMLLHGKAALNERFKKLQFAARVYDDEKRPSAVVAESWFASNKKHGLLAPYGVGTIDQALLAVLQTKHVFVRLFGLAGKCVILDEVHAYDAYMTTLMERLLRWLAALGCPVVLLSATLPREKRLKLLRAYGGDDLDESENVPYPRLTTVTIGDRKVLVQHVKADPKREQTITLSWLGQEDLAEMLRQALQDGGCAVVIRNTVRMAQETYLQLRDVLKADGIEIELFHARFPFKRRDEIETSVLKRFGKEGGPAERNRCVLVATQVVEQSLDLDFDVMVSDVAPVDLVLQRAGRLHRHERGKRPVGVAEPRLWLIEPEKKEILPDFGGSEWVYARYILLRSYLALQLVGSIRLPDDLEHFVEQVYGEASLAVPEHWQTALDKSKRDLTEEQRSQRMKAKGVMVYRPDDEDLLRQQNLQLDEDNPEAAEKIRTATRDTEPTLQVILVYHMEGRDFLDGSCEEPFEETEKPSLRRIRKLLDNEVTINHPRCVAFYLGRSVPKGWRECGMLRHHRLIRIDASGNSLSSEYSLRFDRDIGVEFTREANKGAS